MPIKNPQKIIFIFVFFIIFLLPVLVSGAVRCNGPTDTVNCPSPVFTCISGNKIQITNQACRAGVGGYWCNIINTIQNNCPATISCNATFTGTITRTTTCKTGSKPGVNDACMPDTPITKNCDPEKVECVGTDGNTLKITPAQYCAPGSPASCVTPTALPPTDCTAMTTTSCETKNGIDSVLTQKYTCNTSQKKCVANSVQRKQCDPESFVCTENVLIRKYQKCIPATQTAPAYCSNITEQKDDCNKRTDSRCDGNVLKYTKYICSAGAKMCLSAPEETKNCDQDFKVKCDTQGNPAHDIIKKATSVCDRGAVDCVPSEIWWAIEDCGIKKSCSTKCMSSAETGGEDPWQTQISNYCQSPDNGLHYECKHDAPFGILKYCVGDNYQVGQARCGGGDAGGQPCPLPDGTVFGVCPGGTGNITCQGGQTTACPGDVIEIDIQTHICADFGNQNYTCATGVQVFGKPNAGCVEGPIIKKTTPCGPPSKSTVTYCSLPAGVQCTFTAENPGTCITTSVGTPGCAINISTVCDGPCGDGDDGNDPPPPGGCSGAGQTNPSSQCVNGVCSSMGFCGTSDCSSCNNGGCSSGTNPFSQCLNGVCTSVNSCGASDCSNCNDSPPPPGGCGSGQTNPFSQCVNGVCSSIDSCGVSDCSSCGGGGCSGAGQTNPYSVCDAETKACKSVAGCGTSDCSSCGDGGGKRYSKCDALTKQCISVEGLRVNSCQDNGDCQNISHTECNLLGQCISVNEPGKNLCSNSKPGDCQNNFHNECDANTLNCIVVPGPGKNTCSDNGDCQKKYTACDTNKQCVLKPGKSSNECSVFDNPNDPNSCKNTTHNECDPNTLVCENVPGSGPDYPDTCANNFDCQTKSYEGCDTNKQCVVLPGESPNECSASDPASCQGTHNECNVYTSFCENVPGAGPDYPDTCSDYTDCQNKPPTVTDLQVLRMQCIGILGTGALSFQWTYSDSENDPESRFWLEVDDDNSNFSSPEVLREVRNPGSALNQQLVLAKLTPTKECNRSINPYCTPSDYINYNKGYYWRVKVQENANGFLRDSEWISGGQYTLTGHPDPAPSFIFFPKPQVPGGIVSFWDLSICYNNSGARVDCNSYNWNFGDNSAPSTAKDISHAYAAKGNYPATLTVYDDAGVGCFAGQTVPITDTGSNELPNWKEISPFK